jgi:hypothetical protein
MPIHSNHASTTILISALSRPRLSSYKAFFGQPSDAELLGLYAWNEEVSAALFRMISLIEIVLRNQFHRTLSANYGIAGSSSSKDWYRHLLLTSESKKKVEKILFRRANGQLIPRTPFPTPDDVVSKVTFGFWPHLLDVAQDAAGQQVKWGKLLPSVFPGHRYPLEAYWKKQAHQDALFARLDLCNELRNRIAHHEPIWKLGALMEETRERPNRQRTQIAPAPATPADAIARLNLVYDHLCELLGWLSQDMLGATRGSESDARLRMLLTERAATHYRLRRPTASVDVSRFRGGRGMRQLLRYAARNRQPMHLTEGSASLGHWICPPR